MNLDVKIDEHEHDHDPGALPGPPRAPPELPRADPDLLSLPMPPELSSNVFSTFVGTSQAKPYFLRAFLEGRRPKMVSEVGVLYGAVMKKSKKHCTGASPESPSTVKHI